jgi:hypothetical protein
MRLSIKQFQDIIEVNKMSIDDLEKSIFFVMILTGKTEFEVNKMSVKKFNKLCKVVLDEFELMAKGLNESKPVNLIKANGRWYWLDYDIKKMTTGQYVETATFGLDLMSNLHKLLATMATPMKWTWKGLKPVKEKNHEQVAEDMLEAEFRHCYHAAVFFYALFKESILNLSPYLESQTEKKQELKEALIGFKKSSDGFTMPKWFQNLKISV